MSQIATTIEQSKKLIELGIDVNTADMYYYKENVFNNALATFNGALLVKGNSKPEIEYTIPAWSLSALIEQIQDSAGLAKDYGLWFCYDNSKSHCTKHYNNPVDAAFEMVCYLLENKLIK